MGTGGNSLTVLLIFAIGGLLFGALVMYLIMDAVRGQKEAREVVHTQPLPKTEPMQASPALEIKESAEDVLLPMAEESLDKALDFSVWREKEGSQIRIKMDGQWHENIDSMDETQKIRLRTALQESAAWLELLLVNEEQAQINEKNGAPSAAIPKAEGMANKAIPQLIDAPLRKKTIVEQVDDILQDILIAEGQKERNIRLSEMVNRGVIVWIGQKYYEGIESVPDDEVKEFVRRAVRIWEDTASSI